MDHVGPRIALNFVSPVVNASSLKAAMQTYVMDSYPDSGVENNPNDLKM